MLFIHLSRAAAQSRPGDRARGISAERFEIPLAGGAAVTMRAGGVGWRAACAAWGEPARPGFSRRGNGKGEIEFLAPQAVSAAVPVALPCFDGFVYSSLFQWATAQAALPVSVSFRKPSWRRSTANSHATSFRATASVARFRFPFSRSMACSRARSLSQRGASFAASINTVCR